MNPALAALAPSLIRALHARKQPGDIDFSLGEPTLRPHVADFEAAMAWVRANGCPYAPNAGSSALREAVAAYLGAADAAEVCITVGSEEAIFLALKTVLDPATDEVLVVEPSYLAYPKLCTLEGIAHRSVPLDSRNGFAPSAQRVLEALGPATRMVVLASPCNPTGRIWPDAELRALAAGLAARSGPPVWVLADEVYRELYYTPEPPTSMASLYPHTLVAGSLSKSNALTGLRLGWLRAPAEVITQAVKAHALVNTTVSTVSEQVALALFCREGAPGEQRALYAGQRATLLDLLDRYGIPHIPPDGAFYAMLRLPPEWAANSLGAAERLLDQHHVVAVPGTAFGVSAEGWLRISWVAAPDALAGGIARINEFFSASQ